MNNQLKASPSTFERLLFKLKKATKPVTEILHRNDDFQVIVIGFNAGAVMPDHLTKVPAKLTVLSGSIVYQDANGVTPLFCFDELAIPENMMHSIRGIRQSICLLTRG